MDGVGRLTEVDENGKSLRAAGARKCGTKVASGIGGKEHAVQQLAEVTIAR